MEMAVRTGSLFDQLEQLGSGSGYVAKIADMLESADMFRDLNRKEVEIFANYIQSYAAAKGIKVLEEGVRENYMFVVASGKLDIFKRSANNHDEKRIATVRAGKTIGEMSILDGMPHSASAIVVEPATLLLLTKNKFEQFMQNEPEVALKILRKMAVLMSLRLRQTSGVLIDHLPK
jgi:CRP-like cAMP-binding protein